MARKNWNRLNPITLTGAIQLCVDYARERKNQSVDSVADQMGVSINTLYKWIATGRLPALHIPDFESACGQIYVTRYLASSAGHIAIRIPLGRRSDLKDLSDLAIYTHTVLALLVQFYGDQAAADETAAALTSLIGDLAQHRANIQAFQQPQLCLEDRP